LFSRDQGVLIAKRSLSLSRAYVVIGIFLALLSVLISSLPKILTIIPSTTNLPSNSTAALGVLSNIPLVSVPLQVFACISFTTPVLLLYVYDKNNGVLEYFLSLGLDQGDIYRRYLKASLILALSLLAFEVIVNFIAGLIEGAGRLVFLYVPALVVVIAIPVVCFAALIMMAFSSLQKQRVGSNQPLGIALGIFIVFPAYVFPLVDPSQAVNLDIILASVLVALSIVMYYLASSLISREKMLP